MDSKLDEQDAEFETSDGKLIYIPREIVSLKIAKVDMVEMAEMATETVIVTEVKDQEQEQDQ
jgi:hypothetical protein